MPLCIHLSLVSPHDSGCVGCLNTFHCSANRNYYEITRRVQAKVHSCASLRQPIQPLFDPAKLIVLRGAQLLQAQSVFSSPCAFWRPNEIAQWWSNSFCGHYNLCPTQSSDLKRLFFEQEKREVTQQLELALREEKTPTRSSAKFLEELQIFSSHFLFLKIFRLSDLPQNIWRVCLRRTGA